MSLSPEQLTTINSLYTKLAATPKTDRAQIKSLALEYYDSIKPVDAWYATMAQNVIKDEGLSAITANNYAYNKLNHDLGLDYPSHVPEIWKGLAMADYEARKDKKDGHLKKLSGADIAQYHTDVFKQVYGSASKAEEAWTAYHITKVFGSESWVGKDEFWDGLWNIYLPMQWGAKFSNPKAPEYRHYFEWIQDMRAFAWDGRKGWFEKGDSVMWKSLGECMKDMDPKLEDMITKWQIMLKIGVEANILEEYFLHVLHGYSETLSKPLSRIKNFIQKTASRIKIEHKKINKILDAEKSLTSVKQDIMLASYKQPDEPKLELIAFLTTPHVPEISKPVQLASLNPDLLSLPTLKKSLSKAARNEEKVSGEMLKLINEYTPEKILFAINNKHVKAGKKDSLIIGTQGNDKLAGGNGDDLIIGGEGNDTLKAGDGNNILIGGPGADKLISYNTEGMLNYLYGGEGNDKIIITSPAEMHDDKRFMLENQKFIVEGGKGDDIITVNDRFLDPLKISFCCNEAPPRNVTFVLHKGDGHDLVHNYSIYFCTNNITIYFPDIEDLSDLSIKHYCIEKDDQYDNEYSVCTQPFNILTLQITSTGDSISFSEFFCFDKISLKFKDKMIDLPPQKEQPITREMYNNFIRTAEKKYDQERHAPTGEDKALIRTVRDVMTDISSSETVEEDLSAPSFQEASAILEPAVLSYQDLQRHDIDNPLYHLQDEQQDDLLHTSSDMHHMFHDDALVA
ncbi:hypothetical protein B488_05410 [Liberibacter crescens BT-1]|uniref:Hemolysin-type calcium-binding region n=1 Tax=Liberibacter crescens (strain BT-1) TaxID=1215343 RepID=L0EV71_LIBCB|nr:calcium-binding protein [Liberibacter crescens]AGA64533.1 hypothetical protein B488_05410 [Liberibacter crescens BT-1]